MRVFGLSLNFPKSYVVHILSHLTKKKKKNSYTAHTSRDFRLLIRHTRLTCSFQLSTGTLNFVKEKNNNIKSTSLCNLIQLFAFTYIIYIPDVCMYVHSINCANE